MRRLAFEFIRLILEAGVILGLELLVAVLINEAICIVLLEILPKLILRLILRIPKALLHSLLNLVRAHPVVDVFLVKVL